MGNKISGFAHALYDPKRKEFLGRDGAAWGKLGVFYFFFYLGLAGFFCAMLAVFMALAPKDRPRYYSEASSMRTRSNPLAPGMGFRPQPEVDKNIILVQKNARNNNNNNNNNNSNVYVKNLDQYLQVYYWQKDPVKTSVNGDDDNDRQDFADRPSKFVISNPGHCTSANQYGFNRGQPCVLVKMNKVVGFTPRPGSTPEERDTYRQLCDQRSNAVSVHCYGEYPADADNIGTLNYISENTWSPKCGSLETKWFPYKGKTDRQDVYQAPYIWVQFLNPKPNVLINVLCRLYGQNIDFDKKTGRALTRFQIYVDGSSANQGSKRSEF